MLCGPYALFLEALSDERLKNYRHVWAVEDKNELKRLSELYKDHKNVSFVKYGKTGYIKMLATAKYLINNVSFPDYYTKKNGQVYVNTWHGIPLKTLGFDMPDGSLSVSNVLSNFMKTDYMISASPFLTDIYKHAYKLDGLYKGKIIEEGYPRLDTLFRFDRNEVFEKLDSLGVKCDRSKKVILYAPTWRGADYDHAVADVRSLTAFKENLESLIDKDEYQVIVKPHQRVFQLAGDEMRDSFFVPANIDANEVLSVTDILISDFSSIFYDYLALDRPILFYIENIDEYKQERGMYHGAEHLPGPVASNIAELSSYVNDITNIRDKWKEKYDEVRNYANAGIPYGISKKILDIVFFKNTDGYNISSCETSKKKILISRGKMLVNGITSAFLNLLDNISYDDYDVTVMIMKCAADNSDALYKRINKNARVVYIKSGYNMTLLENITHRLRLRFGTKSPYHEVYKREWDRRFGGMDFDCIVDFEGYNRFNIYQILQNRDTRKVIWLHNDMYAEYKLRFWWLMNIFKMYKYFDCISACGAEIMEVNKKTLSGRFFDDDRLTYVDNLIDYKKVLEGAKEDRITDRNGEKKYLVREAYVQEKQLKNGKTETVAFDDEYMPFIPSASENGERNIRFVNVARLSPEKNQEVLIRAFKRFHDEHKNSYLYILGNGPLKEALEELIAKLGLAGYVFVPGFVTDPYIVMDNSDCFILPSLHEGQPVVVNEARILKLPIILSDFSSVNGVTAPNGQLLIGHDEEAVYSGLKAFYDGKVPNDHSFDYEKYNRNAVNSFYKVISGQ